MNDKIIKILKTTAGALTFSLMCGIAYFLLAVKFVLSTTEHGRLMLLFIGPIVLFGAALIIIKLVKQNIANDNRSGNLLLFWLHIWLLVISIIFAMSTFM